MENFHVEFKCFGDIFLGEMIEELLFKINSEFNIINHSLKILSLLALTAYPFDFSNHETLIFIFTATEILLAQ